MMKLEFLTPVVYNYSGSTFLKRVAHSLEENIDAYFFLGGKRAHLILKTEDGKYFAKTNEGKYFVNFENDDRASFRQIVLDAIKIASWFTLVIPAFLMAGKLLFRYAHHDYPLEVTVEHGRLSARQEHFFKELTPLISKAPNHSHDEIKKDLIGMLSDKELNKRSSLYPDIEIQKEDGSLEFVREIGSQFYHDSSRVDGITINGLSITDCLHKNAIDNKEQNSKDKGDELRREITQKFMQKLGIDLGKSITPWIHQSFNSKDINDIFTFLYKGLGTKKEEPIYSLNNIGGYQFDVTTDDENIQLEGTLYLSINDNFPIENSGNFIDRDKLGEKPLPLGCLGIYKRIFVPKADLKYYVSGKDIPRLKVDPIAGPLSKSVGDAKKLMSKAVGQLESNFKSTSRPA